MSASDASDASDDGEEEELAFDEHGRTAIVPATTVSCVGLCRADQSSRARGGLRAAYLKVTTQTRMRGRSTHQRHLLGSGRRHT